MDYVSSLLSGLFTGYGLIIAIGAQNAFVITQGLKKEFHWQIVLTCSVIDAVLIIFGLLGMGTLIQQSETILHLVTWGGIIFLFLYGTKAFINGIKGEYLDTNDMAPTKLLSRKQAMLTTLTLSLFNPHVYLDTVVLLGSIGGRLPMPMKMAFGLGAIIASFTWFITLGITAYLVAPWFKKPILWRVLDIFVGFVMWAVAIALYLYYSA